MSASMERITQKALRLGVPLSAHVDLTWRCNLRCVHCYLAERDGPELSAAEFGRLLEEMAGCGTLFLCLSGGEVLLRPDCFEILGQARRLGFSVTVKTNGTLLGEEAAARLARLHVARVDISVYSHRPEAHDAITRAPGSLARSLEAVRRLVARGVPVRIVQVLMRPVARDYPEVRRLARELGAGYALDPAVTPRLDGDLSVTALNVSHEIWRAVFEDSGLQEAPTERCPSSPEIPGRAADRAVDELPCSAGHTFCYVSPSGDVFPCVQFPLLLGNAREQGFARVWRESPAALRLRAIRVKDLSVCRDCELLDMCTRCPGLAYMEGDMLGPSRMDCEKAFARTGRMPRSLAGACCAPRAPT